MEKEIASHQNSQNFYSILGILWLYCDLKKSIHYFQILQNLNPQDPIIKSILSFLLAKADQNNKKTEKSNHPDEKIL